MEDDVEGKKLLLTFAVILGAVILGALFLSVFGAYITTQIDDDFELGQQAVILETLKDVFIDVDGDGDLDFVHSVQFVRQRVLTSEASNPYPAPNQPGQQP